MSNRQYLFLTDRVIADDSWRHSTYVLSDYFPPVGKPEGREFRVSIPALRPAGDHYWPKVYDEAAEINTLRSMGAVGRSEPE